MNRAVNHDRSDEGWRKEPRKRPFPANRPDLKPEEFCRSRDRASPAYLTPQQCQALEALKARRDLFI